MFLNRNRTCWLTTLIALSLSACGPAPTGQPGPPAAAGPTSAPVNQPTAQPSAQPSGQTPAAEPVQELTVHLQADASLAGFATAQQSDFTLCLGQIAEVSTRLSLPGSLPDAATRA